MLGTLVHTLLAPSCTRTDLFYKLKCQLYSYTTLSLVNGFCVMMICVEASVYAKAFVYIEALVRILISA